MIIIVYNKQGYKEAININDSRFMFMSKDNITKTIKDYIEEYQSNKEYSDIITFFNEEKNMFSEVVNIEYFEIK